MLRVVMIDDEVLGITLLENLIQDIDEVLVVGKFTCFEEALKNLEQLEPHVVFLDIEMPGKNGLEVAKQIMQIDESIDIVFVTAYDQYAIEAFNVHAVDYLLKPTEKDRLKRTIDKIMKRRITLTESKVENQLEVQFIGNFVFYGKDGTPIKWRTKKVKELCAYLLRNKEAVHRLKIIEDLWPNLSLDKAGTLLHTTVYQLRKELKRQGLTNPLTYVDERYSLNITLPNDIEQVTQIIKQSKFDDESILSVVELTLKGFLGLEDYPWSVPSKENTFIMCKQFLEKYIANFLSAKTKPKVLSNVLEAMIELDPYLEIYYRELINYNLELNNIKKALEIYSNLKVILMVEFGELPNEETEKLIKKYK